MWRRFLMRNEHGEKVILRRRNSGFTASISTLKGRLYGGCQHFVLKVDY